MIRYTVERNLLVQATREPSEQRTQALLVAVRAVQNWQHAQELAYTHGVIPLLLQALTEGDPPWRDALPEGVLRELRVAATALALKSGVQRAALTQALATLDAAGVTPVVLKGAGLAETLYTRPELRPSQDLDLLCRPEQMGIAGATLATLGYERCEQKPTELDGFHIVYAHPTRPLVIELHEDALQLGLPARCLPALWEHLETHSLSNAYGDSSETRIRTLSAEYLIPQLCVHLHTHGYGRLIWFKDLDLLLRRRGATVDWARVQAIARAEGATLSLRHALLNVRELLGTPLPEAALRGLRHDPLGEMAHRMLWPQHHVLALTSTQRLRSLRFNPHLGIMGTLPSVIVMGRRREKLARLL